MTDSKRLRCIIERIEALHARESAVHQEIFDVQREISKLTGGTKHTYIFEADGLGLVKIGRTSDVRKRLSRLQKGSPVGLRMIRLFTFDCEQLLHQHYADFRQHGEWFKFCPTMHTVFEPRQKSSVHRALAVPAVSQGTALPQPEHSKPVAVPLQDGDNAPSFQKGAPITTGVCVPSTSFAEPDLAIPSFLRRERVSA